MGENRERNVTGSHPSENPKQEGSISVYILTLNRERVGAERRQKTEGSIGATRGIDGRNLHGRETETSEAVVKMSKPRGEVPETRRLGPRARERGAGTISINSCAPAEAGTRGGIAHQVSSTGA